MNILSIKPIYVEKILNGFKKYEFRKTLFKSSVRKIEIYSSAPVQKVVGSFIPQKIIKDSPINLWKNFQEDSGVTEEEFFCYFQKKDFGYAIEIA